MRKKADKLGLKKKEKEESVESEESENKIPYENRNYVNSDESNWILYKRKLQIIM